MRRNPRRDPQQTKVPHRMTPAAELSATAVEFLSAGTRTGMLGFVAQDGRPLVAPVWFVVDKGDLVLNTAKGSAKGQALMRDPRVVLCVDDPHRRMVSFRCRAPASCPKTQTNCSTSQRVPVPATSVPTAPRNSAAETESPANSSSGYGRPKSSPPSASPNNQPT